jgi:hypothetical protein
VRKSNHPAIRELLRRHPDGLTIREILEALPQLKDQKAARKALGNMVDAYIDRWQLPERARGQFASVWCVVQVPDYCPYPTARFEEIKTNWQNARPHA